ncbi:MFS general substrate transporter [Athelia psychrophila]|uniref:MFS general substrate transporter n=1 Tax=Athelia psychrophila TaxID=1759441 RepID=A0A166NK75_9AGAM|nr:MFS general substrate transporter [Fibularhizoctonia sp. CBS 109695]
MTPIDERQPLLAGSSPARKSFYRPRPIWLAPFAIIAALVRGMTLAPRVQVFTQLACGSLNTEFNHSIAISNLSPNASLYSSNTNNPYSSPYFAIDAAGPHHILHFPQSRAAEVSEPHVLPADYCSSDPSVQAGAARIQTILTTTSGVLSALTTGWWGHFGERHGRTRVLALATLGLFITDLAFILVSTPNTPFSAHGHKLLIIAPFIEGVLGGWSTLQGATLAYISDCTSDGSRAQVFSRYNGVFYVGLSLGPLIGAQILKHPFNPIGSLVGGATSPLSVTSVFWVAISFSLLNFLLVAFVFPESLSKEAREKKTLAAAAAAAHEVEIAEATPGKVGKDWVGLGFLRAFFGPLALFLPTDVEDVKGNKRKDWSLTYLALASFGYMLGMGIFQIKYMYAVHVYKWGPGQLSYYISLLGGLRAVALLLVLPFLIATFKPKPKKASSSHAQPGVPVKPTPALLAQEMSFDLLLARLSFMIEIISHTSVASLPNPASQPTTYQTSIFVVASSLSSFSAGVVPAVQSLALCITQSRALAISNAGGVAHEVGPGKLFGALAMLQAAGQMIIGPMLFGVIYSKTVASFPDAIFATAAAFMIAAFSLVLMIRPDTGVKGGPRTKTDAERGRPRRSKDLRQSIATYGSGGESSGSQGSYSP